MQIITYKAQLHDIGCFQPIGLSKSLISRWICRIVYEDYCKFDLIINVNNRDSVEARGALYPFCNDFSSTGKYICPIYNLPVLETGVKERV